MAPGVAESFTLDYGAFNHGVGKARALPEIEEPANPSTS